MTIRNKMAPLAEVEAFVAELRIPREAERAAWERRFMSLETEVYRTRERGKAARALHKDNRKKVAR